MLHEYSDCQNFMLLHLIGNMIIFLRSHRVVLSVSMNWLWYWEVSVNMMSYTLWRYNNVSFEDIDIQRTCMDPYTTQHVI